MSPIALLSLAVGAIGHVILSVAIVNRIHAVSMDRRWIDGITVLCGAMMCLIPLIAGAVFLGLLPVSSAWIAIILSRALWCYVVACVVIVAVAIVQRSLWHYHPERRGSLLSNHTSFVAKPTSDTCLTAPGIPTWLSKLPGNEVLKLCVQEKEIAIPRLAHAGQPLRIVHISDLHMSGRIARAYFERVVDEVNGLDADLVAITGDIVEYEKCLNWVPPTIGRLRAAHGVYYVLGNHDRKVNEARLKVALGDAGLVYVGGTCYELTIHGLPLILAGNELPWYRPAADLRDCPEHDSAGLPVRILLAHSPDQLNWARNHDIDLMLAGHLHGGQVRFPIIGAIFAPSHHGVRYISGVFTAGNTVMHVSRGTGSLTPLRYNCPPEIAVLTLRPGRSG